MPKKPDPREALVECARQFYERRWMWGTAGNLSVRLASNPLTIAVSPSGLHKGTLKVEELLDVKEGAPPPKHPMGLAPSAETAVHQAIYQAIPGAGAVFHVHPVHATLVSTIFGDPKEHRLLRMDWIEMLKGIGIAEGENPEISIFPNWQDASRVAADVGTYLRKTAKAPPVIFIYGHGLTAWGTTPDQARNHLEIMEWVCEYLCLKRIAASV